MRQNALMNHTVNFFELRALREIHHTIGPRVNILAVSTSRRLRSVRDCSPWTDRSLDGRRSREKYFAQISLINELEPTHRLVLGDFASCHVFRERTR